MATSEEPLVAAAGVRDERSGERLTLRQARLLEVLVAAGAPVIGEAVAAELGVLQRRGLIVAAAREAHAPAAGSCTARREPLARTRGCVGLFCLHPGVRSVASSISGEGLSMNKSELLIRRPRRASLQNSHSERKSAIACPGRTCP